MKYIKKLIGAIIFSLFIAAPAMSFALPNNTFAATHDKTCEQSILGIPTWFRGLAVRDSTGTCTIASPGSDLDGKPLDLTGFIWRIALNIVDIGLSVAGIIAFFFILYGGFQFLTGGSNPAQVEKARKTIINAVVGLIISLGAVAIINLVFGVLG